MQYINTFWIILFFFCNNVTAQITAVNKDCPPNIGFESGSLNNWECASGSILKDGTLSLTNTGPVSDRHTLIQNYLPQELDYYGNFPVNCPNGSGFSARLGNSRAGGEAESISYTFTIPSTQNDYSILYNYAVVFQNPPHRPEEQPRFTSKIFNVTDNQYITCGSFEFVASSTLPGFILSPFGTNVYYKTWSPVTVNLTGLAGKTVRLEFSTNDCAFTQHFGYAYLDVNEDCSSGPIAGNTYCKQAESVILTAPFGFATYSWFTPDFSQLLGNENILTIKPAPPANTMYAIVITPYDGVGCEDTLFTTINASPENFKLNVQTEIFGCPTGVDITAASITAGSTQGLTYSYYNDLNQTDYVPVPSKISTSGTYYIKGINKVGCNDIKPIKVVVLDPPPLLITNPLGVCKPEKIDITLPEITSGSETGLAFSYWTNAGTTIPVTNANAIEKSGTYYIRGSKVGGCDAVEPVEVKIGEIPIITINNPVGCGKVDLTHPSVIAASTQDITYSYWMNAATTEALTEPNLVTKSGTYYIISSASSGCSITNPVSVTINPLPDFIVTDPLPVEYPIMTIDLTSAVKQTPGLTFSYWLDSVTRKPLRDPKAVDKRGRYFIRATNQFGCSVIKPVNAVIIPPLKPIIYAPTAFTPNNDGLNDVFRIKIVGETSISQFKIFNRWGQLIYDDTDLNRQWNGKLKGIDLPAGVYVWIIDGMDTYLNKSFAQKGLITVIR